MHLQHTPISPLSPRARTQHQIAVPATTTREPFIYVRVSTYAQKTAGFSLPHQFQVCREAARAQGLEVPEANRLHDADSGKKFDRPALQALLGAAREGRISLAIFPKVDRIGRNARDARNIVHELHECGVEIIICDPHIDTRTPMGMFLFTMLAAMAELEAEWIKERTVSGKLEKLSQLEDAKRAPSAGANSAPYGYRYVPPQKPGQDGTWERHPDQWRWVLFILEQVALGHGSAHVAKMLNERAVPPARGRAWVPQRVRDIIRYAGYTGAMTRRMQNETFTFALPEIVPPALWTQANATIDGHRKTARRNAKRDYLLSSTREEPLLCCKICHEQGKQYMMGGRAQFRAGSESPWLHYRCNGINGHFVSAHKMETAIWDALVGMLAHPRVVLDDLARLSDRASARYRAHEEALAGLHERAAEIRAAQVRVAEAAAWGKLPADILQQQADALVEQEQQIASQISLAHVQLEQAKAETVPIKDIEDACALLAKGAQEASFEQRRWIVHTLVHRIYADKTHWELQGRLPCMTAEGTLPQRTASDASIGTARSCARCRTTRRAMAQRCVSDGPS